MVNLHSSSRACPILHNRIQSVTYPHSGGSPLSTWRRRSLERLWACALSLVLVLLLDLFTATSDRFPTG